MHMIDNCSPSRVARYMGLKKPQCHGGAGCGACWKKYHSKAAADLRLKRAYGGRYVMPDTNNVERYG